MKILIIQTAYLGDVILMTSMIESLAHHLGSSAEIDVLVRTENASILSNNPHVDQIHTFEKRSHKYQNLRRTVQVVRKKGFDVVFNCHRFASSGYITLRSGAGIKIGFDKNPLSFRYSGVAEHVYEEGVHELDRNHGLLLQWQPDIKMQMPRLYPSGADHKSAQEFISKPFYVIAPASVWHTKQYPEEGWLNLIERLGGPSLLIGGKNDWSLCESIAEKSSGRATNLAGRLSLLQSAALVSKSLGIYANDSAPTHIGTAMNIPTHSVFCSTSPFFGFGPRADQSFVHETTEKLDCRPCGIHGKKKCPEGHFLCSKFQIPL